MSTDTRSAAAQWAKTHIRYHCPRRTKVPAWDPYGGAKVVATETNVKHARPERPLGDILIAEGDSFWANPDTPKIRELVGQGRIVALAPLAPTPDQLAQAFVDGELKGKPGIGKAFLAEIGEALVTEGLILASDLTA